MASERAGEVVTGIFRRPSTQSTVVYLDGRLIGECAWGLPQEAQRMWLEKVRRSLSIADLVSVVSGSAPSGVAANSEPTSSLDRAIGPEETSPGNVDRS